MLQTAFWVIEIDAREADRTVYFRITPTARCLADCPGAAQTTYSIPHPDPANGPYFQARMLVNREGFIPDGGYETLVRLVRIATDLSVRHRVLAYRERREGRREARRERAQERQARPTTSRLALQETVRQTVQAASDLAAQARQQAAAWQFDEAQELIDRAAAQFGNAAHVAEQLVTEPTTLRVIASVGLQMVSFVHEIKTVLATAGELDQTLKRLRSTGKVYPSSGTVFARLHADVNRMRQEIERQASYLTDITSPDGQRRRSRHSLRERFEAAATYVQDAARRTEIELVNDLPAELRSPPMFRSELAMVFTNLLTNAVKAAGSKGRIRAWSSADTDAVPLIVRVENSGRAVDLADAEKWFRPFQSTTVDTDPLLGQGMGMGLPITRDLLEEYGATIAFALPSDGFATALELRFPAAAGGAASAPDA